MYTHYFAPYRSVLQKRLGKAQADIGEESMGCSTDSEPTLVPYHVGVICACA